MSALALTEAALEEAALQGRSGATLADIWAKLRIPATPQPSAASEAAGGLTGATVHMNSSATPPRMCRGLREAIWAQLSKHKDVTFVAPPLSEVAMVPGGAAAQQAANRDGVRLVASQERRLRALGLNDPTRAAPFLEVRDAFMLVGGCTCAPLATAQHRILDGRDQIWNEYRDIGRKPLPSSAWMPPRYVLPSFSLLSWRLTL